jgi:hypothetical protein
MTARHSDGINHYLGMATRPEDNKFLRHPAPFRLMSR